MKKIHFGKPMPLMNIVSGYHTAEAEDVLGLIERALRENTYLVE